MESKSAVIVLMGGDWSTVGGGPLICHYKPTPHIEISIFPCCFRTNKKTTLDLKVISFTTGTAGAGVGQETSMIFFNKSSHPGQVIILV